MTSVRYCILALFVTVALIFFIGHAVGWHGVFDALLGANYGWVVFGAAAYLLNYFLRAVRFWVIFGVPGRLLFPIFAITTVHGALVYLLPFKSGELTFPWLVKRYVNVGLSESAAALVFVRLLDLSSVAILIPFVGIFAQGEVRPALLWACFLYVVLVALLAAAIVCFLKCNEHVENKYVEINNYNNRVWRQLVLALNSLSVALRSVHQSGVYLRSIFISLSIWLVVYVAFYCAIASIGYEVEFWQVVFISALMIPMSIVPFHGFANFGGHEAAFFIVLGVAGYSRSDILSVAVGSHLIIAGFVLVIGLTGLLLLKALFLDKKP